VLNHDDFVIAALLEEGVMDRAAVDAARTFAVERSVSMSEAIVAQGKISSRDLAIIKAETSEHPYVDLAAYDINFHNSALLSRTTAESLLVFPLFVWNDVATVGMENPLDLKAVDQLRALLKVDIDPVVCQTEALRELIDRAYALSSRSDSSAVQGAAATTNLSDAISLKLGKEPIVAAVNQIIAQAVELGASDIHLGPDEVELHLRYRIDGTLRPFQGPGLASHSGLIQRLKVMANIDLTQSRRPQDGKFRIVHNGRNVDVRLSIIPTVCGENAVMRLLASNANIKDFPSLGIPPEECAAFASTISNPYGMVLVTGPTGSGKTTTLYTAIKSLNQPEVNIVTIEDPVEIRLPRIRQIQVNPEVGMTFAGALRSILRHDPDVVFVGEIRDEETARISVQAALTGHLVLSSLHTNDAPGAVARLRDLGCPAFAINAALLGVLAQRLVRRVCNDCAKPFAPSTELMTQFEITPEQGQFVRGAGCARCSNSGYRGRIGVYEMLRMSAPIRHAVEVNQDAATLRRLAERHGMRPMWRDGLNKARVGLTTLDEVARVVAVQATESAALELDASASQAPARLSA